MEFKELIEKRRSIRKFSDRAVPRETVDRILRETLTAPSARNTRTTRLMVVDDPALVARMAEMRDYGSAFMKGAPLAFVVLGDTSKSDLWRENAAISATLLQLYKTARNKIMTTMKKKMNICETPIPECELDTYEAVAYEEQFTFDDLKNVLTSNEIKMLRQHFIEGYSIKEISIANSMKIGTGTMKFSRMYKKIKNSKC